MEISVLAEMGDLCAQDIFTAPWAGSVFDHVLTSAGRCSDHPGRDRYESFVGVFA